jgi:hypothetical protein
MQQSRFGSFLHILIAGLFVVTLCACGGNKSPTAPDQGLHVTSLTLTPGTDFMTVGQTADLSLQATWSNGRQETMQGTWGSDNTHVATVSAGHVEALAPGQVTISAECTHGRATRVVRVVPEYRGSWMGAYTVRACTETGDFETEHGCREFEPGSQAPIGLRLDRDRDRVSGTLILGGLSGDATGQIDIPGNLALTGSVRYEEQGIAVNVAVSDWATFAERDDMTGRFAETWTATAMSGNMRWECELVSMRRTSQTVQPLLVRPMPAGLSLPARLAYIAGIRR